MNTEQATSSPGKPIALFPDFDRDCLIIRPGESIWLNCVSGIPEAEGALCEIRTASNHFPCALMVQTIPDDTSSLILHPSVIPSGERLRVRVTNPSSQVCVLVKKNCDISSRLGHGIFRKAAVLQTTSPIAYASLLASLPGSKGVCAS